MINLHRPIRLFIILVACNLTTSGQIVYILFLSNAVLRVAYLPRVTMSYLTQVIQDECSSPYRLHGFSVILRLRYTLLYLLIL